MRTSPCYFLAAAAAGSGLRSKRTSRHSSAKNPHVTARNSSATHSGLSARRKANRVGLAGFTTSDDAASFPRRQPGFFLSETRAQVQDRPRQ